MIFYGIKRKPSGMRGKRKKKEIFFREVFFFSAFFLFSAVISREYATSVEGEKKKCVCDARRKRCCLSSIFLLAKQHKTKSGGEREKGRVFHVCVRKNFFFTLHFSLFALRHPYPVSDDVSQCLLMLCINFLASFLLVVFFCSSRMPGRRLITFRTI
jgi:hypothetical protein